MDYRHHIKRLLASRGEPLSWTEIVNQNQGLTAKGIKDLRRDLLALVLEGYVVRKSFDRFEYVVDGRRSGSRSAHPLGYSGKKLRANDDLTESPTIGFLVVKRRKLVVATLRSDPAREFRIMGLPGKAVIGDLVRFNLVHDSSGNDVAKFVSLIEGQSNIEAKAIAMACSTLVHLDLKQGAIANALRSPQGDGATALSSKRTATASSAAPQSREVMPSLLLDLHAGELGAANPAQP